MKLFGSLFQENLPSGGKRENWMQQQRKTKKQRGQKMKSTRIQIQLKTKVDGEYHNSILDYAFSNNT